MKKAPQQRQGTFMIIAGWALALLTLTLFFQGVLDERQNPNTLSVLSGQSGEVILQKNANGQYFADGWLNGREVTFLLDTGATQIAIPPGIADALNLPRHGRSVASTAGGDVPVYGTTIDELRLGSLRFSQLKGSIVPSMSGGVVLLGMNALGKLHITQRGDTLILRPDEGV